MKRGTVKEEETGEEEGALAQVGFGKAGENHRLWHDPEDEGGEGGGEGGGERGGGEWLGRWVGGRGGEVRVGVLLAGEGGGGGGGGRGVEGLEEGGGGGGRSPLSSSEFLGYGGGHLPFSSSSSSSSSSFSVQDAHSLPFSFVFLGGFGKGGRASFGVSHGDRGRSFLFKEDVQGGVYLVPYAFDGTGELSLLFCLFGWVGRWVLDGRGWWLGGLGGRGWWVGEWVGGKDGPGRGKAQTHRWSGGGLRCFHLPSTSPDDSRPCWVGGKEKKRVREETQIGEEAIASTPTHPPNPLLTYPGTSATMWPRLNSKARHACGATSTKDARPAACMRAQCCLPMTRVAPSPSRMRARMGGGG